MKLLFVCTAVCGEVIKLDQGSFLGKSFETPVKDADGMAWYSIPYGSAVRFKAPSPPPKTQGIVDATTPKSSCMIDTTSVLNFGAKPIEDCLNLNIYAPAGERSNLSVLVYVYPCAFKDGFKDFKVYNEGAKKMAMSNVIIVTIDYREGAFGFLPAKELKSSGGITLTN